MEKLTGLCVLLAALSLAVTEDKTFTDDDSLTLDVRPSNPDITNILWKFDGSLLAEWIKDKVPVEFYRSFKDRSTLDTTNGQLVVNRMSKNDAGVYSVEINSKVQSLSYTAKYQKRLSHIEVVLQPSACPSSKECNVSCEGDTTEAEPVTYSWKMGAGEWKEGLGKKFEITDIKHVHDKNFTCRITNKVSEKVSKTIDNPFYKEPTPPIDTRAIGFSALGVTVVVVVVLLLLWKFKKWPFQNQGANTSDPAGDSTSPTEEHALKNNPTV